MKKFFLSFFTLFICLIFFFPINVFSQQGCCSWHGGISHCDSSVGRYVCNDGTYSPSCGCAYAPPAPRFILPAPVNPERGDWNYKINSTWCSYDLEMTWDKPVSGDRFSIAASKYAGSDPGPNVDTSELKYTLTDLTPGRWYVNIKTGNAERWSGINYWTIDLPEITPGLKVTSNSPNTIDYEIACLENVEGPTEFINYLDSNNKSPTGTVNFSFSNPTDVTIKGWDSTGKEYSQIVTVAGSTLDSKNASTTDTGDFIGWIIGGIAFVIWLGYQILKWTLEKLRKIDSEQWKAYFKVFLWIVGIGAFLYWVGTSDNSLSDSGSYYEESDSEYYDQSSYTYSEAIDSNWDEISEYVSGYEYIEACSESSGNCYELEADISDGYLNTIEFDNGGYLEFYEKFDSSGYLYAEDEEGNGWEFYLDMDSSIVTDAVDDWALNNEYDIE